jgi:hypothetical protein
MIKDVIPRSYERDDDSSVFEIFGFLGPLAFLWVAFFYGVIAYHLFIAKIYGVPVYLVIGMLVLVLLPGAGLFFFRDIRNWRSAAILQIIIAAAAGVAVLFIDTNPTSKVLTVAGAVVAAANGIKRFWDIASS